ncbi:hemicentin-1-like [Pollicipes pollicipes]|uniref:hemicentin-1-like n=1 Tax=Pollicipes pollicipes TaxID=41117 RepID=UPI001885362C|nr:hemicentin-1-like [Pollicipes pollicipes]
MQITELSVPVHTARGVVGGDVTLPCAAMSPRPGDKLELVLWYRHDSSSPFYTYDGRGQPQRRGKHMTDDLSAPRGRVGLTFDPWGLEVGALQERDAGTYVCRAEFEASSTQTSVIQLEVIVPPGEPLVFDDRRRVVTNWTSAVPEGRSLFLTCEVSQGSPPPTLTWTLNGRELDTATSIAVDGTVRSDLEMSRVTRADLAAQLTCTAANTNLTTSKAVSVRVDMVLAPLVTQIRNVPLAVSEGRVYQVTCHSSGSRPPAAITWTLDDRKVTSGIVEKISAGGNLTTSSFSLTVPAVRRPLRLRCSARNPHLPLAPASGDTKHLVVYYKPIVTLEFGRNLDPNRIREGNDVYFECNIQAHPPVDQVQWLHKGRWLEPSRQEGIIITAHSLVLPNVSMAQSGDYACQAANAEGRSRSRPVALHVLYAPRCEQPSQVLYFLPGRPVEVTCRVTSEPAKVRFKWVINRSTAERETIDVNRFTSSGRSSVLRYTLGSAEYAVIACRGSNAVGLQRQPCVFQMLPASVPGQLSECDIHNQTVTSFELTCEEGPSGGLRQHFVLTVWRDRHKQLVHNVTSETPHFRLDGLAAGVNFTLQVYAANEKGRGKITTLQVGTLELMLDRVAFSVAPSAGPVAAVLSGAVLAVLMLAVCVLVTLRRRAGAARRRKPDAPSAASAVDKEEASGREQMGPDIVPSAIEMSHRSGDAPLVRSCLPEGDISSPYYRQRWRAAVDGAGLPVDTRLLAGSPPSLRSTEDDSR